MNSLKTILLAEDNPNDVELTLEAFNACNLANQVVVVQNGEEALDYLHCTGAFADRPIGNPAVVLLDIKMPKMDGLETARRIRADGQLKTVPIVMLTSSREEQDLVRSYGIGVNSYVVKPVEFRAFVEAVKHVGIFWALINEPPPGSVKAGLSLK